MHTTIKRVGISPACGSHSFLFAVLVRFSACACSVTTTARTQQTSYKKPKTRYTTIYNKCNENSNTHNNKKREPFLLLAVRSFCCLGSFLCLRLASQQSTAHKNKLRYEQHS
jgi:hypothetical protein